MLDKEQKQVLRTIQKIRVKLDKLEKSVKEKLISEGTYVLLKSLIEEVSGLELDFQIKLDFDWRLAEEEFKVKE